MPKRINRQAREDLSIERAEQYAPRPTGGLVMAGVCGAGLALVGDMVVSGFYGWRVLDHGLIAVIVTAMGFAAGVAVYLRLARRSRKARKQELAQIHSDLDGP